MKDLPIDRFRRLLVTGSDLGETMTWFFDHLVSEPAFLNAGRPVTPPEDLRTTVGEIFVRVWKKRLLRMKWTLLEVPLGNLIHGMVRVNGRESMLVYATDINTGILSIPSEPVPGRILYARFSLTKVPDPGKAQ